MGEFDFGFHFTEVATDGYEGEDEGEGDEGGEGVEGWVEADGGEEECAEEEADAFDGVFGACEDGD